MTDKQSTTQSIWSDLHKTYSTTSWINKPSLFAQAVIEFFPKKGRILDLGAGQGQDSRYFAEKGYEVVSTDIEQEALDIARSKLSSKLKQKVKIEKVDLSVKLPYPDESCDVVYAHLSLHYFDHETTKKIFDEIYRVLIKGGVLAFFTNSTSDPEYGDGEELEPDFFRVGNNIKRYLSVETARNFARKFEELLADNKGETYKDDAKGVHNLIRFIGQKTRNV